MHYYANTRKLAARVCRFLLKENSTNGHALKKNTILLNFGNTAPLANLSKQGVMIHDLAFLRHPEWFSKGFSLYYKILAPIIAKKSKFLMTVSEFSKREIVKLLKVPEEKVLVLPLWLSDNFESETDSENKDRDPFILSVASLDPRKNYESLIHAFLGLNMDSLSLYAVGGGSTSEPGWLASMMTTLLAE